MVLFVMNRDTMKEQLLRWMMDGKLIRAEVRERQLNAYSLPEAPPSFLMFSSSGIYPGCSAFISEWFPIG